MKKIIVIPLLLILSFAAIYVIALFVLNDFNIDFLKIDSCLDAGGRWNYEARYCKK
jgi:hypothetical protein